MVFQRALKLLQLGLIGFQELERRFECVAMGFIVIQEVGKGFNVSEIRFQRVSRNQMKFENVSTN